MVTSNNFTIMLWHGSCICQLSKVLFLYQVNKCFLLPIESTNLRKATTCRNLLNRWIAIVPRILVVDSSSHCSTPLQNLSVLYTMSAMLSLLNSSSDIEKMSLAVRVEAPLLVCFPLVGAALLLVDGLEGSEDF